MKKHLQFHWWKYLIVILLPTVVWCSVFQAMAQPGRDEQVNILYFGDDLDTDSLQQQLSAALPGLTRQALKSVTVTVASPEEASYSTLEARCFDYDILIFEKSSMPQNVGQAVFVRLTDGLLEQFSTAQLYQEEVEEAGILTYGFRLDPDSQNSFAACYGGSEPCYLFISPYSVNFDGLNEYGTSGNDAALKAVQFLMEMTP